MRLFRIPTSLPLSSQGHDSCWEMVTAHRRRGSKRWIMFERGFDHDAICGRLSVWLNTRPKGERGQYLFGEVPPGLCQAAIENELARVDLVDGRMTYEGRELLAVDDDGNV